MSKEASLGKVATLLNVNPAWIDRIIKSESNWNPLAAGKAAYNQFDVTNYGDVPKYPKGLIQFIDSTAQGLGYKDSQDLIDKHSSIESQLENPVYEYFKRLKPFIDENDFYLSVFLPSMRGKPLNTLLSAKVRSANKGLNTVQDYIDRVKGVQAKMALSIGTIVIIGVIIYFILKKQKL